MQPPEVADELRAGVFRQGRPLGRMDTVEFVRGLAQRRLEAANAEAGEDRLHAVHKPRLLAHQGLALAADPPRVFLGNRRNPHHTAVALLAAQPAEKGARQQLRVEFAQYSSKLVLADLKGVGASEIVAGFAKGTRVVKAFNSIPMITFGPGRTRTCNQTVMSDRISISFVDIAAFSFDFVRVCRSSKR